MPYSVQQLADEHLNWARMYYRHADGTPTRHANNVADAMRSLLKVCGTVPASDFSLKDLVRLQTSLVEEGSCCRNTINARIRLVKACFAWGAQQGLVDELVPHKLNSIRPLKRGRSAARETSRVRGVEWCRVSDTLPHLTLMYATMVELQWLTAMRPGEVCAMRKSEIRMTQDDLWHYCPPRHKTAHHGIPRRISMGPTSINLIRAWLPRAKGDLLFEGGRHRPNGKPCNVMAYRNAINRACKAAKIKPWSPGQIRHSALTRTYNENDIETAMQQAGHTTQKTTRVYIDRPDDAMTLADEAARRHG